MKLGTTLDSLETKVGDSLASHKAKLDFSIQRAFGANLASHLACKYWSKVNSVSIEVELGQYIAFSVYSGTYFRAMARGDLTINIFMCLRTLVGLEPPSREVAQTSFGQIG